MVHFTGSDIVLFVIAVFLPPLAVVFKDGCGWPFLISLALTLFGYLPGVLHAWWVIYTKREDPRRRTITVVTPNGSHRRSYVEVASEGLPHPSGGTVKTIKVVEERVVQVPEGQQHIIQGRPQSQVFEHQQHGATQQHTTTSTKTLPNGQIHTTTTTTTSGPTRTTKTVHTTQQVSAKDQITSQ